jgi:hypothetical protein
MEGRLSEGDVVLFVSRRWEADLACLSAFDNKKITGGKTKKHKIPETQSGTSYG